MCIYKTFVFFFFLAKKKTIKPLSVSCGELSCVLVQRFNISGHLRLARQKKIREVVFTFPYRMLFLLCCRFLFWCHPSVIYSLAIVFQFCVVFSRYCLFFFFLPILRHLLLVSLTLTFRRLIVSSFHFQMLFFLFFFIVFPFWCLFVVVFQL